MERIKDSVGRGGANQRDDATLVQQLLNKCRFTNPITPLKVDGLIGALSIERIELFQRDGVGMHNPDGRVDPDGRTFNKLLESAYAPRPASELELSDEAIDLLKQIEQLATTPYDDQTGQDIDAWTEGATIGYGHLVSETEWPAFKNGVTETEAEALFKHDLEPFVKTIQDTVTADLTQQQFDAMVILTFNIGKRGFESSSVLQLVNNPEAITSYPDLESAWKAWNKSQGKVMQGLVNRRNAEWSIYAEGLYQRW